MILEASSHGLKQNRLNGLNFKTGIFTNLSHDHLDYHKSFKDYLKSKLLLPEFDEDEFKASEVAEKLKLQLKKLELIRLLSDQMLKRKRLELPEHQVPKNGHNSGKRINRATTATSVTKRILVSLLRGVI